MHSFSSVCIAFGRKPISTISSITARRPGGESGWLIACITRAICSGSMAGAGRQLTDAGQHVACEKIHFRAYNVLHSVEPAAPSGPCPARPGIPGRPPGHPAIPSGAGILRHGHGLRAVAACPGGKTGHLIAGGRAGGIAGRRRASAAGRRRAGRSSRRRRRRRLFAGRAPAARWRSRSPCSPCRSRWKGPVLEHRLGGVLDDLLDHQQQHRGDRRARRGGERQANRPASAQRHERRSSSCSNDLDLRSPPGSTRPGPAGSG